MPAKRTAKAPQVKVEEPVTITEDAPVVEEPTPTVEPVVQQAPVEPVAAPVERPKVVVSDAAMNFVDHLLRPHFINLRTDDTLAKVRDGLASGKVVLALRKPFEIETLDADYAGQSSEALKALRPGRFLFCISEYVAKAKLYRAS